MVTIHKHMCVCGLRQVVSGHQDRCAGWVNGCGCERECACSCARSGQVGIGRARNGCRVVRLEIGPTSCGLISIAIHLERRLHSKSFV